MNNIKLNKNHPLAMGMVGWWVALPGQTYNHKMFDLTGVGDAFATTITHQSGLVGPTVGASYDPGGTETVAMKAPSNARRKGNNITVSLWVRNLNAQWDLKLYMGCEGTWAIGTINNNKIGSYDWWDFAYFISSATIDNGGVKWWHIVAVFDGSLNKCSIYLDGVISDLERQYTMDITMTNDIWFGSMRNVQNFATADIVDPMLWTRKLSPQEISQLYNESKMGYPQLLTRNSTDPFLLKGAGFSPWLAQSPSVLGSGIL